MKIYQIELQILKNTKPFLVLVVVVVVVAVVILSTEITGLAALFESILSTKSFIKVSFFK
jgi:hypothetical protein